MRYLPVLALLALLVPPQAFAAETAWTDLAPGVRARLIASEVRHKDGTTLVGLEIEMPETTKTYWRVPGETGIPTEIDVAGSTGVSGATLLWPYPRVETASGYLDYVYYGHTVLPIELKVDGDAPVLNATVTMGVCSDICVPAVASFSFPLSFTEPDKGQGLRLNQALAETPMAWQERHDAISSARFDPAANALEIVLGDPEVDWSSLIADMGFDGELFGTPQKSPDGRTILLPLLGGGDPADLVGKPVTLTFQTPMGPFETSSRVQASLQK
jgi:DsbC/DsbD-like thiol-disulfide interchange protein